MQIKVFSFNPFQEKTYVIYDEETSDCAIIDPGCYYDDEKQKLVIFLTENQLVPTKILYTHCHLDHVFGAKFLAEQYPLVKFYAHPYENYFIEHALEEWQKFGITIQQPPAISHFVSEQEKIFIGSIILQVICTPGHSLGGVCYYCEKEKVLFCGDTIFAGSVGRTDLFGGNEDTLINSIRQKIFTLPDETQLYCGHGYPTTIGNEKQSNPYL